MSIADKLTYLNEAKSLLREAINAAGGNLTQETPFREYAGGWLRDQSASLNLDFSKQQYVAKDKVSMFPDRVGFEDIVTFTRSTGGGRFNAQGQYEWVGPDEPRIDYDPLTGECLGLLVEEKRTNLLLRSSKFDNAYWDKSNTFVTPNATLAPDGSLTADLLMSVDSSGVNVFVHARRYFPADDLQKTFSIYVKQSSTHAYVGISDVSGSVFVFDMSNGVFISDMSSLDGYGSELTAMGFWRIWVTSTQSANGYYGVIPCNAAGSEFYAPDGTEQVYVWGAQLEAGAFPTSYIPTEGAQVTRAADIASVNELSPWYNSDEGSFIVECVPMGARQSFFINMRGGIGSQVNGTMQVGVYNAGDSNVPYSIVFGEVNIVAMTHEGLNIRGFAAGRASGMTSNNTWKDGGPLLIGHGPSATRPLNGQIRSIRYFPRRLPDSELQEITA